MKVTSSAPYVLCVWRDPTCYAGTAFAAIAYGIIIGPVNIGAVGTSLVEYI